MTCRIKHWFLAFMLNFVEWDFTLWCIDLISLYVEAASSWKGGWVFTLLITDTVWRLFCFSRVASKQNQKAILDVWCSGSQKEALLHGTCCWRNVGTKGVWLLFLGKTYVKPRNVGGLGVKGLKNVKLCKPRQSTFECFIVLSSGHRYNGSKTSSRGNVRGWGTDIPRNWTCFVLN